MKMNKTQIEKITITIVSIIAMCLVTLSVYSDYKVYRQKSLFYELQILRMGVNIYRLLNYRNPSEISELTNMGYKFPGESTDRYFVEGVRKNDKGQLVDPFGNVYSYDRLAGWVRSSTRGYEFW